LFAKIAQLAQIHIKLFSRHFHHSLPWALSSSLCPVHIMKFFFN